MRRVDKPVLVVPQPDQGEAGQRRSPEIEARRLFGLPDFPRLDFRVRLTGEVVKRHRHLGRRMDDLPQIALCPREGGAEHFMPLDNFADATRQHRNIEPPCDARTPRHCQRRSARFSQRPKGFLAVGRRKFGWPRSGRFHQTVPPLRGHGPRSLEPIQPTSENRRTSRARFRSRMRRESRAAMTAAVSESPPRSKKLSCRSISSRSNISRHSPARNVLCRCAARRQCWRSLPTDRSSAGHRDQFCRKA